MRAILMLCAMLGVASCDGFYRITVEMPYCPASDSAKKAADSIPVGCLFPDSTRDTTR